MFAINMHILFKLYLHNLIYRVFISYLEHFEATKLLSLRWSAQKSIDNNHNLYNDNCSYEIK